MVRVKCICNTMVPYISQYFFSNTSLHLTIFFRSNNIALRKSVTLASYVYIVGGYRRIFKMIGYTCDNKV